MKKVFVSGSRSIVSLPITIKTVIDKLIKNDSIFLIGDCDGVDSEVQKYLSEKMYNNVVIYTSGSEPRNFYGNISWKIVHLDAKNNGTTDEAERDYYALKDKAMTEDCDVALAIWDGQSRATLSNISRTESMGKPTAVYKVIADYINGVKTYDITRIK